MNTNICLNNNSVPKNKPHTEGTKRKIGLANRGVWVKYKCDNCGIKCEEKISHFKKSRTILIIKKYIMENKTLQQIIEEAVKEFEEKSKLDWFNYSPRQEMVNLYNTLHYKDIKSFLSSAITKSVERAVSMQCEECKTNWKNENT